MPFIKQDRREEINRLGVIACKDVGDICYVFYKALVKKWREEPRWRTAHHLYKQNQGDNDEFVWETWEILKATFDITDVFAARDLAWHVFFDLYVMPYERDKEKINGTI